MTPLTMRPYQEECLQQHLDFFAHNPTGNPLFVLPTGSGKGALIAEFVRRSITAWPSTRFLILTHVMELIRQNHSEFLRQANGMASLTGIYSAGIGRRDTGSQVLFAGIQSIYKRADELGSFDLVLIDESDLVPMKGLGRYRSYLEALREINPTVRVCGYTATHFRLDGGYLHKGDGRLFTDVAYEIHLETLIKGGYLVPLIAKKPENVIDTSSVGRSMSDFVLKDLERAALADGIVEAAVRETIHYGELFDRHHWLVFCVGIEHAEVVKAELKSQSGLDVELVTHLTPKDERDKMVTAFRDGKLPVLVNVGVLTRGFNAPCCDLMAVMRPTQSAALYVQIMGRGMRPFPGKENCIVLDFGENVERHGPINKVRPKKQDSSNPEDKAPLQKVCPECQSIVLLNAMVCPDCGFEWPASEMAEAHAKIASYLSPIDMSANRPQLVEVRNVFYRQHTSKKGSMSMRVDYACGMRMFTEWVCVEHQGYAGQKACQWWGRHGGNVPLPITVEEAIERHGELNTPETIEVTPEGKYDRITDVFFKDEEPSDGEW